ARRSRAVLRRHQCRQPGHGRACVRGRGPVLHPRPRSTRNRRRHPLPAMNSSAAHTRRAHAAGFTLVELAMVLVILALLGGSLLVPLASRIEARDRQAALERLRDIQSALTGFAIIHGRLPCPSTETDPADARYGVEDAAPCTFAVEGRL